MKPMKRALLNEVLSRRPDKPLYHYTTQKGLLGIIHSREMWVTHTQYLNDRREFVLAVELVRQEIARLRTTARKNSPRATCLAQMDDAMQSAWWGPWTISICVCSFSEDRDSLSQWRAYGVGSGFAIGFPPDLISEVAARQQWYLAKCVYEPELQREIVTLLLEEVLDENLARSRDPRDHGLDMTQIPPKDQEKLLNDFYTAGGNLLAYLNRYAPILKDESFSEEREWRVITRPLPNPLFDTSKSYCFREGRSLLVPYSKLPLCADDLKFRLREVVVGPTPDPERSGSSVRSFLAQEGPRPFATRANAVRISKVPYRDW